MGDAANLRNTLSQTENTMPGIQSSSREMMRFYDKPGGPSLAVSEWRSVLQTSPPSLSLPLLYVANEVLQTSKRNRGSKFLEAFSPVLGSSLTFIVGRDRSVVEKVRRTVKVWGDRRVFSMRFVLDLLAGLDNYREGGSGVAPTMEQQSVTASTAAATAAPKPSSPTSSDKRPSVSSSNDDDDDEDMFGGASDGQKLLDISIDVSALSEAKSSGFGDGAAKRRRTSKLNSSTLQTNVTKKPKVLSGQNFLELFQSIANLDEKYKSSMGVVEAIPPSYLDDSSADIDDLVGDELTSMYKNICDTQRKILRERRSMYSIAVQRRDLEKEAKRYVSWLKNLAKVDDDDIKFVDKLEKKLEVISVCHGEYTHYCLFFSLPCCTLFHLCN
ncbi:hypothetical protein ACHAXM_003816 [Skeletonema potamos]